MPQPAPAHSPPDVTGETPNRISRIENVEAPASSDLALSCISIASIKSTMPTSFSKSPQIDATASKIFPDLGNPRATTSIADPISALESLLEKRSQGLASSSVKFSTHAEQWADLSRQTVLAGGTLLERMKTMRDEAEASVAQAARAREEAVRAEAMALRHHAGVAEALSLLENLQQDHGRGLDLANDVQQYGKSFKSWDSAASEKERRYMGALRERHRAEEATRARYTDEIARQEAEKVQRDTVRAQEEAARALEQREFATTRASLEASRKKEVALRKEIASLQRKLKVVVETITGAAATSEEEDETKMAVDASAFSASSSRPPSLSSNATPVAVVTTAVGASSSISFQGSPTPFAPSVIVVPGRQDRDTSTHSQKSPSSISCRPVTSGFVSTRAEAGRTVDTDHPPASTSLPSGLRSSSADLVGAQRFPAAPTLSAPSSPTPSPDPEFVVREESEPEDTMSPAASPLVVQRTSRRPASEAFNSLAQTSDAMQQEAFETPAGVSSPASAARLASEAAIVPLIGSHTRSVSPQESQQQRPSPPMSSVHDGEASTSLAQRSPSIGIDAYHRPYSEKHMATSKPLPGNHPSEHHGTTSHSSQASTAPGPRMAGDNEPSSVETWAQPPQLRWSSWGGTTRGRRDSNPAALGDERSNNLGWKSGLDGATPSPSSDPSNNDPTPEGTRTASLPAADGGWAIEYPPQVPRDWLLDPAFLEVRKGLRVRIQHTRGVEEGYLESFGGEYEGKEVRVLDVSAGWNGMTVTVLVEDARELEISAHYLRPIMPCRASGYALVLDGEHKGKVVRPTNRGAGIWLVIIDDNVPEELWSEQLCLWQHPDSTFDPDNDNAGYPPTRPAHHCASNTSTSVGTESGTRSTQGYPYQRHPNPALTPASDDPVKRAFRQEQSQERHERSERRQRVGANAGYLEPASSQTSTATESVKKRTRVRVDINDRRQVNSQAELRRLPSGGERPLAQRIQSAGALRVAPPWDESRDEPDLLSRMSVDGHSRTSHRQQGHDASSDHDGVTSGYGERGRKGNASGFASDSTSSTGRLGSTIVAQGQGTRGRGHGGYKGNRSEKLLDRIT